MRVLYAGRDDAAGHPSFGRARTLEKYGPLLDAAMVALGKTLGDFLDSSGAQVDYAVLRSQYLEPILALARTLPVFRRAVDWVSHRAEGVELQRILLEGRSMGFDAQTLLLDAFFQNSPGTRSLRARASFLVGMYHDEMGALRRQKTDSERTLVLGASSVLNLTSPFPGHPAPAHTSVVIVDSDTQALRRARQRIEEGLKTRSALLRSEPESVVLYRDRVKPPFDVVYTLGLYDLLPVEAALELTRGIAEMLKPGGSLLTGCYLPTLPAPYRALAKAFVGMDWKYWDEATWRDMLVGLSFDLSASRLDVVAPDTLMIVARRVGR